MHDILIFGSSHVHAVRNAYARASTAGTSQLRIITFDDGHPRYRPFVTSTAKGPVYSPVFLDDMRAAIEEHRPTMLVSMLAGSMWVPHGFVRNPRDFDFVLPSEPDRPLDERAELVPYAAVRTLFEQNSRHVYSVVKVLKSITTVPIVHFAAPPAIGDSKDILDLMTPEMGMRERIAENGVTPPNLRYKIWRTFTDVVRDTLHALGGDFVEPPQESQDAAGFLRPIYYANDPVHANALYGELLLRQMEDYADTVSKGSRNVA